MGNKELWRNMATHDKIVHPVEQNWLHVRHCVCVDAMDSGCALRCAWVLYTNSAYALRCAPTQHILCTAQHPSAKDSTAQHTRTHSFALAPSLAGLFLNSGFSYFYRGKEKNDRHYPLRYAETLCWILHNMLHTLLLSGLETGNRRLFDDGGSISCLPADPRWLAAGRSLSQGFYFFGFFLVFVLFFHFFFAYKGRRLVDVAFRT